MRLDEAQTLARDIRNALPDAIVRTQFIGRITGQYPGDGYILRVKPDPRAQYWRVDNRAEWEGLRPRLERAALRGEAS